MAINPNEWSNPGTQQSPPIEWQALDQDGRWYVGQGISDFWDPVQFDGNIESLPDTLEFEWELVQDGEFGGAARLQYTFDGLTYADEELFRFTDPERPLSGSFILQRPSNATTFGFRMRFSSGNEFYGNIVALKLLLEEPCDTSYNCECSEDPGARTLADMRQELMVRLGYAAQLNNPPPGMVALLGSFLRDTQAQLYHRFTTFKTERFFTWPLEAGVRYYGLGENNDCCEGATLDPYKISWVGVEDASGVWYPLTHGIPPESYTMTDNWQGWPARYEVRECVEIFPAPSAGMKKLRIKGHFGLRPFTEDEHKTTINPDVLFLWALGTAKSHYGQSDAGVYFQQANDLIGRLVAGSHQTARYIPGRWSRRPLTPPKFLPISED